MPGGAALRRRELAAVHVVEVPADASENASGNALHQDPFSRSLKKEKQGRRVIKEIVSC